MAKLRSGKHSRWGRELQRRLGSSALWHLVSFTGKFDVAFLTPAGQGGNVRASQPDAEQMNEAQRLTEVAQKARARLRYAEHLARKRASGRLFRHATYANMHGEITPKIQKLLNEFDNGVLLAQANEATKKSGHGRIKQTDGSFKDIGSNTGGLTRTILDGWVEPESSDDSEEEWQWQ